MTRSMTDIFDFLGRPYSLFTFDHSMIWNMCRASHCEVALNSTSLNAGLDHDLIHDSG